jgi:hypothetical protein
MYMDIGELYVENGSGAMPGSIQGTHDSLISKRVCEIDAEAYTGTLMYCITLKKVPFDQVVCQLIKQGKLLKDRIWTSVVGTR